MNEGLHNHLPRLTAEAYQRFAMVHWSMTLHDRSTGWLDKLLHARIREILLHTLVRYEMFCPAYCLMPDHLHLFCRPACHDAENIRAWMRYWKALVTRTWLCPSEKPLWQQDGWDTQLRRGKSYQSKWEYVRLNPVRARLVTAPEDWPFQGELNSLAWHES